MCGVSFKLKATEAALAIDFYATTSCPIAGVGRDNFISENLVHADVLTNASPILDKGKLYATMRRKNLQNVLASSTPLSCGRSPS